MTREDFSAQIFAISEAIHTELRAHPLNEKLRAPKDWNDLQSIVRRVAEDLILCADVNEAIARLRQDPPALLTVEWLTNRAPVSEDDYMLAIRRAHADTLHEPSILPFHAFCSYLIELCNGLELRPREN